MPGRVWEDSGGLQVENNLANCPLSKLNSFHLEEEYKGGGKRKGKSKEKRRKRKEDEEEKEKERKKSGKKRKIRSGSSGNGGAGREEEDRDESREENKLFCSGEIRERERRKMGV